MRVKLCNTNDWRKRPWTKFLWYDRWSENNRRITESQNTWQECGWVMTESVARWASVQFLFSGGSNYDWTPMAAARWLVGGLKGICGTDALQRGLMCPSRSPRVNEHCLEPVFPWTLYIFTPPKTHSPSPLWRKYYLSFLLSYGSWWWATTLNFPIR